MQSNTTHPKIQAILDAIQRNEVSVALKNINSLISKQKTKDKLPVETLDIFNLLKALCLVKLHQYGEAKQIYLNYIEKHAKDFTGEPEITLWLHNIGTSLNLYSEMRKLFEPLSLKNTKDEKLTSEHIYLPLREYDFKSAQANAIKLYKLYNKPKYMLFSIFLQYMSVVKNPLNTNIPKDLELCLMFTNKLIKDSGFDNTTKAIKDAFGRDLIRFYIKILKCQEKHDKVFEELMKYSDAYENNETLIDYLVWIYKKTKDQKHLIGVINAFFKVFSDNNGLKNFKFEYILYEKFIDFLIENLPNDYDQNAFISSFHSQSNYNFEPLKVDESNFVVILDKFIQGINLLMHKINHDEKEHPNAMYARKVGITTKLYLLRKIIMTKQTNESSSLLEEIFKSLVEYSENFVTTFTYPEEVYKYVILMTKNEQIRLFSTIHDIVIKLKPIVKCIGDINLTKIKIFIECNDNIMDVLKINNMITNLVESYTKSMTDVYNNNKIVEKGERLNNDDYLIILADIVLRFCRNININDYEDDHILLILRTMIILEIGLKKTPYNFDIKLRLMQLYQIFNIPDRIMDIYRTLDIKSIQLDTLGYLFFQSYSSLSYYEPIVELFKDTLSFQIENWKESKESIIACINHQNLQNAEELYEWDKLIQKSYFKELCYIGLLETEFKSSIKKDITTDPPTLNISSLNIEYYIDKILKPFYINNYTINQLYSWNIDMKVCQGHLIQAAIQSNNQCNLPVFCDYFGIYNIPNFMLLRGLRISLLYELISGQDIKLNNICENIKHSKNLLTEINIDNMLDLKKFYIHNHENYIFNNKLNKYNHSEFNILANAEIDNTKFEIMLFEIIFNWLELQIKGKINSNDLGILVNELDSQFKLIINKLNTLKDAKDDTNISTKLKLFSRFMMTTCETFEILTYQFMKIKININKLLKKIKDEEEKKKINQIFKNTHNILKEIKNMIEKILEDYMLNLEKLIQFNNNKAYDIEKLNIIGLFDQNIYSTKLIAENTLKEFSKTREFLYSKFASLTKEKIKIFKAISI